MVMWDTRTRWSLINLGFVLFYEAASEWGVLWSKSGSNDWPK